MPQLEQLYTFPSQIFWLVVTFVGLFLFLRAVARFGPAPQKKRHRPASAPRGFRAAPSRLKLFYKRAHIRARKARAIDRVFALDSVEAIFAALESESHDWARAQLATLKTKSPQALKVTFRQMHEGAKMQSFADEMRSEYRIAARVCALHDFQEGVRALIVDKDNKPVWKPAALEAVSDELIDSIFAPLPPGEDWTPL